MSMDQVINIYYCSWNHGGKIENAEIPMGLIKSKLTSAWLGLKASTDTIIDRHHRRPRAWSQRHVRYGVARSKRAARALAPPLLPSFREWRCPRVASTWRLLVAASASFGFVPPHPSIDSDAALVHSSHQQHCTTAAARRDEDDDQSSWANGTLVNRDCFISPKPNLLLYFKLSSF